ncbi:hypothetical protein ElyMa_000220200 [Elysia marginata]|uniref:Uncharacterized protein n=1 Tax=Elysia marginata TaxID=1093978 RepID=A0AAV4F079_9GAST|nr:hypothetical protein ElyMa_000220200 [Elysia marginata]
MKKERNEDGFEGNRIVRRQRFCIALLIKHLLPASRKCLGRALIIARSHEQRTSTALVEESPQTVKNILLRKTSPDI